MAFNKEVVNNLYTYLQCILNPNFDTELKEKFMSYYYPYHWDEPIIDPHLIKGIKDKE